MAKRLSAAELARTKTDFDTPEERRVKHKGKGNPNGRPPSLDPRRNHIGINLSDAEAEKLTETAKLLNTTKTKVIVEGINRMHTEAAAQAWRQQNAGK